MWSMHSSSGSGVALIVFLLGIVALGIYIYIYSKKQKESKMDNFKENPEDKKIPSNEFEDGNK